ncbi:glycosyltransferase [Exiguobacterium indicum]|uniref:glycosyltransferase n=1 Tax=Exiguobacterium indicum TaxID=296995 RepID=UPI002B25F68A|nr:glycosyltransferase [Exiguobacterium indicum]
MRKILYIGGFELPDKNAAAHRVVNNAKIFTDLGYETIFLNVFRNDESQIMKLDQHKVYNIKYPRKFIDWYTYLCSIKDIIEIYSNNKEIDMIVAYNYPSVALFKLFLFCKKNNVKLVSDCTEWYSNTSENLIWNTIKELDTSLRMSFINKKLDGIIVISELLEKHYKNNKTILIPPLIDIKDEKWSLKKEEYKDDDRSVKLVYAGNPQKSKERLDTIIETLFEIKNYNFKFNIIGINKKDYLTLYPEHKSIINELNSKLLFLGRVDHEIALNIIKASDFSIFLRDSSKMVNAGFPTKFVESSTLGIPSITTNISDLSKYLIDGFNGFFVEIDDKEKLKSKMKNIFELERKEINQIKLNLDINLYFYYKSFVKNMDVFIRSL